MKKNWHEQHLDNRTRSERIADGISSFAGTMKFIYLHIIWWAIWFVLNSLFVHLTFDHYPFNLLTMILSLEAILISTLIMISQNRQGERDRIQAQHDYQTNLDTKRELEELQGVIALIETEKLDKILEEVRK